MSVLAGLLADTNSSLGHMNGWGGGWMWLWGAAMVGLLVAFVVWLVRASDISARHYGTPGHAPSDPTERGREILAERYAKGELSTEEYLERVGHLK